jgi:hypothetical protein
MREVERNETAMVASRAVMSRTRMSELPDWDDTGRRNTCRRALAG